MKPGNLVVRADATVTSGTGHVMRCLALAQAWQDAGGQAIFAMAEGTSAVAERLRNDSFEVERLGVQVGSAADAEKTSQLALQRGATWVVVDGYKFNAEYHASLKSHGLKVLLIDDNGHARHYSADLVVNQNAHASEAFYSSRDTSTRLLLGPRFAMLRREFAPWRLWNREIPPVARRVLVTMGGSDPDNVTQRVVVAIFSQRDFEVEVTVVAGGSNPHLLTLRKLANSNPAVRLVENTSNMPELIARADIAVSAAGTTSWEMCFLGLPALLLVLADNQQGVAEELGNQGVMLNLGRASDLARSAIAHQLRSLTDSSVDRREMSRRGRALVVGRGAERVVSAMKLESLSIRLVEPADCKLLWEWTNDPVVRASAFSSETILWDDHVTWFREKLSDGNCRIFVALGPSGVPVGQIRFDRRGVSEADVDIMIDGRFRGLGYASRLIELGANRAFEEFGINQLNAFVRSENVASAKAFESAGFMPTQSVTVKRQTATHYVRTAQ